MLAHYRLRQDERALSICPGAFGPKWVSYGSSPDEAVATRGRHGEPSARQVLQLRLEPRCNAVVERSERSFVPRAVAEYSL